MAERDHDIPPLSQTEWIAKQQNLEQFNGAQNRFNKKPSILFPTLTIGIDTYFEVNPNILKREKVIILYNDGLIFEKSPDGSENGQQ